MNAITPARDLALSLLPTSPELERTKDDPTLDRQAFRRELDGFDFGLPRCLSEVLPLTLKKASRHIPNPGRRPRVLIVGTRLSTLPAALALRMQATGIDVRAVAPFSRFLDAIPLDFRRGFRGGNFAKLVERAIRDFRPDQIVPCDDYAASILHRLQATQHGSSDGDIAELIVASLGDPSGYDIACSRSRLLVLAAELGISVPLTVPITSVEDAAAALAATGGDVIVKTDGSYGGLGVRRASTVAEIMEFLAQASRPNSRVRALKDTLRGGNTLAFVERRDFRPPAVTAQSIIVGYPANRAVLCERGKVLAGVTVGVREAMPNNGPASVVETIRHARIEDDVATLVRKLGLSGFHGFDFMIDGDGRSWLLELNPRVTPSACLFAEGASPLVATLRRHIAGGEATADDPPAGEIVVLFPQEFQRDPNSPLLHTSAHHVPWSAPRFVRTCLDSTPTRYERFRRLLLGRRVPLATDPKVRFDAFGAASDPALTPDRARNFPP